MTTPFILVAYRGPRWPPPPQAPTPTSASVWGELQTLATTTAAAHNQIIDHYLTQFGGLATELEALGEQPALAGVDGQYPLRQLGAHLSQTDRWNDLTRLLTSSHVFDATATNVWFAAHDYHSTIDSCLDDLDRASPRRASHQRSP